jgi:starch synthase
MKVVYTAPNRGHHYKYAAALNDAGYLYAFISGFPRISPRSKALDLAGKLYRSDILQTLYIASLKGNFPDKVSDWLAFLSKVEQDFACRKFVKACDIFIFYNGSGLCSSRYNRKYGGGINIVEAVNSHLEYQEELLAQEYKYLGLPWKPFLEIEKKRRLMEYEEADYILLPSDFVKRSFIAKGFPESKLLKVPYGFSKSIISGLDHKKNIKTDTLTVLYVGSISVRKGIRYLIEAFRKISHPKKKLLLVGPDTNDGALKGVNLTADIVFTGALKDRQLEAAYESADVFCLPSIEEGLALVLGEALSFGLPIIATCNTGADDIITDGNEGYIVPIRDSEAIRQKLQALADNPELINQIRHNAYTKAANLNGWEETYENLVNTLCLVHSNAYS